MAEEKEQLGQQQEEEGGGEAEEESRRRNGMMKPWEQHSAVINIPRFDYNAPSSLLHRSHSGFLLTCPISNLLTPHHSLSLSITLVLNLYGMYTYGFVFLTIQLLFKFHIYMISLSCCFYKVMKICIFYFFRWENFISTLWIEGFHKKIKERVMVSSQTTHLD